MFRSAESWTVPNTDAGTVGDVRHRPAGVSCFKGIFCFVFHHVSRGQVECFCSLPQFLVGLNLLIAKQEIKFCATGTRSTQSLARTMVNQSISTLEDCTENALKFCLNLKEVQAR